MNLLCGMLLGLVQGVAEFLPISSSGHLALLETILGSGRGGAAVAAMDSSAFFNIMLHLATLIAVVIAYRRDVGEMAAECAAMVRGAGRGKGSASENTAARRLILMILLATLPLGVIVPFHRQLEALNGVSWFIGAALLATGALLYAADRMPRGTKTEGDMTVRDALLIGLSQAAATMPGLSRSGVTITAGMGRGLDREFAVKFSFLMSLLSVPGAVILSLIDVIKDGIGDLSILPPCFAGMAAAGITGYLSIRFLQKLVRRGRFGGFACYCWGVGALTILLWLILK